MTTGAPPDRTPPPDAVAAPPATPSPPSTPPPATTAGLPPDAVAPPPPDAVAGPVAPTTPARRWPGWTRLHLLDNEFPALHGGRVIGVVLVLQLHLSNLMLIHYRIPDNDGFYRSRQLWFVVDFFLALSGFLVSLQLLAALDRPAPLRSAGRFYVRRILRTFPPYYASLALLWALPFATAVQRADAIWEFSYLTNYKMLHRDPLMPWAWSLCVEEHFYAVAPLALLALKRVRSTWGKVTVVSLVWFLAGLERLWTYIRYGHHWTVKERFLQLFVRTHTRLDIVLAGVLLAVLYHHEKEAFERALARPAVRWTLGLITLAATSLLFRRQPPFANRGLWEAICWGSVTSVMMVAFLPLIITNHGWLPRALSAPWMRQVATLSYGMYLLHTPICEHIVLPLLPRLPLTRLSLPASWLLGLALLWSLSLAAAYALHLLVEKPLLALRRRLAPSSASPSAT